MYCALGNINLYRSAMFQAGGLVGQLDTRERSHVEFTEADLTPSDKFTKGSAKLETATLYQ